MYNIDFQKSVLKLMATNVQFSIEYGVNIKQEHFDIQPHRILFNLITDYIYSYEKELDFSNLLIQIEKYVTSNGYGDDTFKVLKVEAKEIYRINISSEDFIKNKIIDFIHRQNMMTALEKSIDILNKDGDINVISSLIDEANSASSINTSLGYTFKDIFKLNSILNERYNPVNLIKTGFYTFDKCCDGGLAPGELHIIQGPAKIGKSTFACNIGANVALQGKNVFHCSFELSKEIILSKYVSRWEKISTSELMSLSNDEYQKRLERLKSLDLGIYVEDWPAGTISAYHIKGWASAIRAKYKVSPDLFIFDYDDLMIPSKGRKGDDYSEAGQIYIEILQLLKYFKCPGIVLAQPNREGINAALEGKTVKSVHLAHAINKSMHCSSISSLNFKGSSDKNGTLYVDLMRRGQGDKYIHLARDLSKSMFWEVAKDI